MASEMQIFWTDDALHSLEETIDYLKEEYDNQSVLKYKEKVRNIVNLLKKFPMAGVKSSERPSLRKILVTRQSSMVYTINDDKLIILLLIDNRMDNII